IPLTVLGVMPGFWLLNVLNAQQVGGYLDGVYFTATAMIGMIALSGIVTRDSIILVDFIHLSLSRGRSLFDAIMESRVVRLRPILLTASAAMLGAVPIIIDPIFSGLAWALIFGLFASTLFTLFVIPVAYWLLYATTPGHGMPVSAMDQEEEPVITVKSGFANHHDKTGEENLNRSPHSAHAGIVLVVNGHDAEGRDRWH